MKQRKRVPYVSTAAFAVGTLGISLGLHAATSFTPNDQPSGYTVPPALSTNWLIMGSRNTAGGGHAFAPWFENGAWQGDLVEYDLDTDGNATTSITVSTNPPTNTTAATNWSARLKFSAQTSTWWDTGRKMITNNAGQVSFDWSSLSVTQKGLLDPATSTGASTSPILEFVRGNRTGEGSTYRVRYSILGDIQHSNPVYVEEPRAQYNFGAYETFKTTYAAREARVYVGANDGTLHVFNAERASTDRGTEVYAYVPSMLMGNLSRLTTLPYRHTYFVDGPLTVGDAQIGTTPTWATVLVGGLGAGGKGIYVLNVTNADLTAEDSTASADQKILYEFNADSDVDLGYTYSKPVIALLNDGNWYAVMGNGYNSADGIAKLYLISLRDGSIRRISTSSGNSGSPNGLSSPALLDTNGDFKADYVYAGDIDGHMWKFDLTSTTAASWALAYQIYDAGTGKAITSAPDIARYNDDYIVYFGTGRILTAADTTDTTAQTVYAILDEGTAPGTISFVTQTLTQKTHTATSKVVRVASNTTVDWSTNKGWKIDLPAGERVVTDVALRAYRLQFTSVNPTVGTSPANWLMTPFHLTGGAPDSTVFDLNADDARDISDNVDGNGDAAPFDDPEDRPMARYMGLGVASRPVFAVIDETSEGGTVDRVYTNRLDLPYIPTCTTDCPDGLVFASIDVMTDSPMGPVQNKSADGLGGDVDGHVTAYDKKHGVVYVDLMNIEPRRGLVSLDAAAGVSTLTRELNRVTEVNKQDGSAPPISSTQKFFVLVTNADLSPDVSITVGDNTWNAKTYQNMITPKIMGLAGAAATTANLVDGTKQLVFTLAEITGTKKLRLSIPNDSFINPSTGNQINGLLGTQAACVRGTRSPYDDTAKTASASSTTGNFHITAVPTGASRDPNANYGFRWRNGAITVQLINADTYALQDYELPRASRNGTGTNYDNFVGGVYARKFTNHTESSNVPTSFTLSLSTGDGGLLYEASMFWDFGDLYENLRQSGQIAKCFGNSNWQAGMNIEQGGLTQGEYNALIANVSTAQLAAYAAALNAFESYTGTDEVERLRLVTALNAAITPIANYVRYRMYVPVSNLPHHLDIDDGYRTPPTTTTTSTTTPSVVLPGFTPTAEATGPNYRPGRRTWTEITPKN